MSCSSEAHLVGLSKNRKGTILRGINKRRVKHTYTDGRYEVLRIPPSSFTSGLFTSTPIQIRVRKGVTGFIDLGVLEWKVTNTGTANVTAVPAIWQIDHITIQGNGTNDVLQTIHDRDLYASLNTLTDEQLRNYNNDNQLNWSSTTYVTPTVIASGATATYKVPLLTAVLNQINPDYMKDDMIVDVYFKPNPVDTVVSGGILTLSEVHLSVHWYNDVRERAFQRAHAPTSSDPLKIFYVDEPSHIETRTLTAGTETEILLTGLNGTFAGFAVFARASTAVASSALATLADLGGTTRSGGIINLTDLAKVSLLGGPRDTTTIRGSHNAFHDGNHLSSTVPIYFLVAAADLKQAVRKGRHTGHYKSSGDTYLYITPGVGFSSGAYEITVVGFRYKAIKMQNGRIELQP
jgi:hypothetical protein